MIRMYYEALLQLVYPHRCLGCGTDVLQKEALICAQCTGALPATGFFNIPGNPVEKSFYGNVKIEHAGAACYFTRDSVMQRLMIALKYQGNKEAGLFLGRMMGRILSGCVRFGDIDILIPVPLNERKLRQRGYNQSFLLCEGIAETWNKKIVADALVRTRFTKTQTKQDRLHRWENMKAVFMVKDVTALENQHILLVDDVITTGATLEACSNSLAAVPGVKLSVAAAAYTI
ncbi:ComF family protein [Sediminibacterium ginsengisoli]|uniref:ComF family protein n=1 Tax=Sediminibacterium ginsengisoli TaxID=413434 RepID=A0A1T4JTK8_9BACT|nr:double zinc ribbon domain-containing protein [Sediminibacterium ginsengisoli]SJZ33526.1 comF family protein [Sediminibacterium ginsengisoli]